MFNTIINIFNTLYLCFIYYSLKYIIYLHYYILQYVLLQYTVIFILFNILTLDVIVLYNIKV